MQYECGDGRKFKTLELAVAHASKVFRETGIVIAVVQIK